MPKLPVSARPGGPGSNRFRLLHAAAAWTASLALILTGCTGDGAGPPTGGSTSVGTGTTGTPAVVERLDLGLQIPWAAVFLPDGTAIISERDSRLLKAVRGGRSATIGELPGVVPAGEGGLLGLALSPAFSSDNLLYFYFTAERDNRIARAVLTADGDGTYTIGPPEVVFTGIPKASTHNGGRIRFGPDGLLYVGTGDSQRREQPQDPNALGGKILRLTPEGLPAPGNPFGNAVYSLGHRNVQGLAWDLSLIHI